MSTRAGLPALCLNTVALKGEALQVFCKGWWWGGGLSICQRCHCKWMYLPICYHLLIMDLGDNYINLATKCAIKSIFLGQRVMCGEGWSAWDQEITKPGLFPCFIRQWIHILLQVSGCFRQHSWHSITGRVSVPRTDGPRSFSSYGQKGALRSTLSFSELSWEDWATE